MGSVGVIVHVTERIQAAEARDRALREVEAGRDRLRRLFMQAPAAVAILRGPEHRVELVNEKFVRMFGDRDYAGRAARDVFPEGEEQGFVALADWVFRTGEAYVGTEVPLEWDRNGDGRSSGASSISCTLRSGDRRTK